MQNIWATRTETGLTGDEFREEVQLHLLRHIGEAHTAFSDQDGWTGKSREQGPPIDVLVVPPEGERRFAFVCTLGCALKKGGDPLGPGGRTRMEFVLAAPQTGKAKGDLAMLNLAANTVRQFGRLVHMQQVRVTPGETVQFSQDPKPVFPGSRQAGFGFITPRLPKDGFETLKLRSGETVAFFSPAPIYRSELQFARAKGPQAFERLLIDGGITEMLDLQRQPLKKSLWDRLASLFGRRQD
jgi:hypothetical protein